ncbi:hypothetical protein K1719_037769 [Acacia pycnantha]|nr:hypothetical protein K1719_037769 [Acacia pycnantha]
MARVVSLFVYNYWASVDCSYWKAYLNLFIFLIKAYLNFWCLKYLENLQRNPKYPDFKHKDTGEALWVEGRTNPPWVKSQLEIMDARMELFPPQNAKTPVSMVSADEFLSF